MLTWHPPKTFSGFVFCCWAHQSLTGVDTHLQNGYLSNSVRALIRSPLSLTKWNIFPVLRCQVKALHTKKSTTSFTVWQYSLSSFLFQDTTSTKYLNIFAIPSILISILTPCLDSTCPTVFTDQVEVSVSWIKKRPSCFYQLHCLISVLLCSRSLVSHISPIQKHRFSINSFFSTKFRSIR